MLAESATADGSSGGSLPRVKSLACAGVVAAGVSMGVDLGVIGFGACSNRSSLVSAGSTGGLGLVDYRLPGQANCPVSFR
jgi:hypothetical protein